MKKVCALMLVATLILTGCATSDIDTMKGNESVVQTVTNEVTPQKEEIGEKLWKEAYDAYREIESLSAPTLENTDKLEEIINTLGRYDDKEVNDKEFALIMSLMQMVYTKVMIMTQSISRNTDEEIVKNAKNLYGVNKSVAERLLGI